MIKRTITLYAFCSAKGGVGKSSLSMALATTLATRPRSVVLIDADLTGTSLADGLKLCSPNVPDGPLDLDAPPSGEFLDLEATRRRRKARANDRQGGPRHLPYFNDALAYIANDQECRIDALLWRQESAAESAGPLFLPSSALMQDVSISLGWLYAQENDFAWVQRLAWLLEELSVRLPALTDVVLDLPPGMLGFTRLALKIMHHLYTETPLPPGYPTWGKDVIWRVRPFLVMTPDRNDWMAALQYYGVYGQFLKPILNKLSGDGDMVKAEMREQQVHLDLDRNLYLVDDLEELRQIFRVGNLKPNDRLREQMASLLLEGS